MGYTTKTLEANKWYLISAGFEAVGGDAINIQDFITGLTPGYDVYDSPNIQYWDGTELKTIIWMNDVWSEDAQDFVVAWADPLAGEMSMLPINAGFGCWIKLPEAGTITCAGEVVTADSVSKTLSTMWELVGNPYPISLDLNNGEKFDCSQLTAGYDVYDSPTIQYWGGTELKTLIWMNDVWSEGAQDFVIAWADPLAGEMMTEVLPPCTGFWIKGVSEETIKFNK